MLNTRARIIIMVKLVQLVQFCQREALVYCKQFYLIQNTWARTRFLTFKETAKIPNNLFKTFDVPIYARQSTCLICNNIFVKGIYFVHAIG